MHPVIWLILTILDIYVWILIAAVILSWLVAFNIINRNNDIVRQVTYALYRLTDRGTLEPVRTLSENWETSMKPYVKPSPSTQPTSAPATGPRMIP